MASLYVISAGAARGIVSGLAQPFEVAHGAAVHGTFGAVGAMRELLLGGASCDVVVLTEAMIATLAATGHVAAGTIRSLGVVATGIAIRAGDVAADIHDEAALRNALSQATSIHFPDPARATAGIHFASVLRALGLHDAIEPRLRTYPNGATAMAALAEAKDERPIGCTQVSEILYTHGVTLMGPLPTRFELATRYDAAVASHAANASLGEAFVALMSGAATRSLRAAGGFQEGSDANRIA